MVLARKDYIQSLEGHLEPFMLHPILATLPPLTEGFELTGGKPPDYRPGCISSSDDLKNIEVVGLETEGDDDYVKAESLAPADVQQDFSSIEIGPSRPLTLDDNITAETVVAADVVKQELLEPSSIADGIGSSRPPTPDPTKPLPPDYDSAQTTQTSQTKIAKPERNALSVSLDVDLPLPSAPIPLPTILAHSDWLLAQYPPSHPLLRLSSIMGPQSVVFTWSESFSDLPSDATAEMMVGRPELVVYPVGPEEMEEGEEEGEGDDESESGSEYDDKSRRKTPGKSTRKRQSGKEGDKGGRLRKSTRRKTIKKKVQKLLKMFGTTTGADQQLTHVDGRTMIAGAVLVLGVAVAIYGVKAQDVVGGMSGAGLNALGGNRLGHLQLHDEMKKVANVLVGVGAKFLNLRDAPAVGTN